jgi:hypothetical protein
MCSQDNLLIKKLGREDGENVETLAFNGNQRNSAVSKYEGNRFKPRRSAETPSTIRNQRTAKGERNIANKDVS